MGELERRLDALKARPKVKAARDLAEVAEGLRIAVSALAPLRAATYSFAGVRSPQAASKIRALFLALFQPIRANMSTNIHVLQTSVLLKYQPLFAFLQRHAPPVALEVQRAYAGAARTYYETGFRRYARTMSQVLARYPEKPDLIANATAPIPQDAKGAALVDVERLSNASIDGPAVTLAYQADDKNFVRARLRLKLARGTDICLRGHAARSRGRAISFAALGAPRQRDGRVLVHPRFLHDDRFAVGAIPGLPERIYVHARCLAAFSHALQPPGRNAV